MEYNRANNITPKTIIKTVGAIMGQTKVADSLKSTKKYYIEDENRNNLAADPVVQYMNRDDLEKLIKKTHKNMEKAAKELDFIEAARLRDELFELQKLKEKK